MSASDRDEKVSETLYDNMGWRDRLPAGWRRLFDRFVANLHGFDPTLRIAHLGTTDGALQIKFEGEAGLSAAAKEAVLAAQIAARSTCEICGEPAARRMDPGEGHAWCEAHERVARIIEAARHQLFGGDREEARRWATDYAIYFGEPPAERALRSPEGLEEVLTMISRLEAGVYI